MKKKHKVAGIGELLWDVLPEGKQLGGAPCNFAFHALQSGLESYVISAIGQDENGDEILKVLNNSGQNTSFIQLNSDYPTGIVSVELDKNGIPDYTIHENVAWDYIRQNSQLEAITEELDAICFGSLAQRSRVSRLTIVSVLKNTRPDCLKVFDINLRQSFYTKETILTSLVFADVLKLNDEELSVLSKIIGIEGDEESLLRQILKEYKLKLIALTKGSEGSILLTNDDISYAGLQNIEVKDTVGAGDAFTAFLVAGMLKNIDLKTIHQLASDVASFVCTRHGATPGLPLQLTEKFKTNL